jgi:hypothetical protein
MEDRMPAARNLTAAVLHAPVDDPDLDRLLVPRQHYRHPKDVLGDNTLSVQEKRAILASWASDACSLPSRPGLRLVPGMDAPVAFDDVMDALRSLDYGPSLRNASDRRTPSPTCDA